MRLTKHLRILRQATPVGNARRCQLHRESIRNRESKSRILINLELLQVDANHLQLRAQG